MSEIHSDALVFFGATGDLAYKKIFPALQALVRRGALDVPVIGVAKAGWNLDQLKARARDSLETHGGGVDAAAFARAWEADRDAFAMFNANDLPEFLKKHPLPMRVVAEDPRRVIVRKP